MRHSLFFFFQAEDGIRVGHVTGVQTCALPISAAVTLISAATPQGLVGLTASSLASVAVDPPAVSFSVTRATGTARSEERRVGKEGRLRGAAAHSTKKEQERANVDHRPGDHTD